MTSDSIIILLEQLFFSLGVYRKRCLESQGGLTRPHSSQLSAPETLLCFRQPLWWGRVDAHQSSRSCLSLPCMTWTGTGWGPTGWVNKSLLITLLHWLQTIPHAPELRLPLLTGVPPPLLLNGISSPSQLSPIELSYQDKEHVLVFRTLSGH